MPQALALGSGGKEGMWEESELVVAFPFAHGECHLFGEDIREPLRSREYPAIQAQAQTRPR